MASTDDLMTAEFRNVVQQGNAKTQRKNPEREPSLSDKYRKIGIKAVAAASSAKSSRDAGGNDGGNKHAKEKASG